MFGSFTDSESTALQFLRKLNMFSI